MAERVVLGKLGESEVEKLDHAIRPDDHVLGFDVAVNDVVLMSGREGPCYLYRNIESFDKRHPFLHPVAQRLTFYELGGDEMDVFDRPDLIDRQDPHVVDCRRGPGFLFEAADAIRLGRESSGQQLERNLAVKPGIQGEMDLSHTACSNFSNDLVMTESASLRDVDDGLLNVYEAVSLASQSRVAKKGRANP